MKLRHVIKFLVIFSQSAGEASVANIDKLRFGKGQTPTADLRNKLQKTMQNHAAVFRDGPTLKEGVDKVYDLINEANDLKVNISRFVYTYTVKFNLKLDNQAQTL